MFRQNPDGRAHVPVVNLGKLKKKLRREMTAHPAKAAVLGILFVVALWFWMPLLWGWFSPRSDGVATVEPPPAMPQLPGFSAAAAPAEASHAIATEYPWQQVVQWMEQDPRTQPVGSPLADRGPATTFLADWLPWSRHERVGRDPFHPSQPEVAVAAETRDPVEQPAPAPVSPQDAGATVSAVVAGPDGGAAIINGRAYRKGEQVLFEKDGRSYAFHLAEIRPGEVVLAHDAMRYVLALPVSADVPRTRNRELAAPDAVP